MNHHFYYAKIKLAPYFNNQALPKTAILNFPDRHSVIKIPISLRFVYKYRPGAQEDTKPGSLLSVSAVLFLPYLNYQH